MLLRHLQRYSEMVLVQGLQIMHENLFNEKLFFDQELHILNRIDILYSKPHKDQNQHDSSKLLVHLHPFHKVIQSLIRFIVQIHALVFGCVAHKATSRDGAARIYLIINQRDAHEYFEAFAAADIVDQIIQIEHFCWLALFEFKV